MAFLKKLTKSEKRIMAANAGYREIEALQKTYCITPFKTDKSRDVITLHYWHDDGNGRKSRRHVEYDRKNRRWV